MDSDQLAGEIEGIIEKYHSSDRVVLSEAFLDGGSDGGAMMLGARLSRAAVNVACGDAAALGRYGIWANTVRDHVLEALRQLEQVGTDGEVVRYLRDAANSMSAFADLQALLEDNCGSRSGERPDRIG